ncbi:MAG: OmpH family outer membrane protein [Planctomycetota bacterium]|nr:MAG: OmpH family outer membrane protein [Planctomycetota bacterium]
MRAKAIFLSFLIGVVVLFMGYQHSRAAPASDRAQPKIGVVGIRQIFQDCKRNVKYRQEAAAEQDKVVVELGKLKREIEVEEAGLKALKAGSSDYLDLMKAVLEKQASLQARQEYHKQQMALKDQRWTEQLYTEILRETAAVAKQKGLDIVFEKDEPELPALSGQELMMIIRTHSVLYSGGCLDITEEVMNRVDEESSKVQK